MIVLALILAAMFLFVYMSSRPKATGAVSPRRTLIYSVVVSALIYVQIFSIVRTPPAVDYWATGWGPFITYLNQVFAWKGSPHRIPTPPGN